MVKLVYSVVEETGRSLDIGEYVTYGIAGEIVASESGECTERVLVHDVTTKKELADMWAKLFEKHQLSLVHLREVIEDKIVMEAER